MDRFSVVSNNIYVKNASAELSWWCRDNLVVTNPKWETLKKLGKEDQISRYHIDEKMNLFVENGLDLIIPFGCLRSVWGLIKNDRIETKFNQVSDIACKNDKITQPLFDYQEEAVGKMVEAKGGVLIGGCGSGKTNCGIEIVKRIGKNALWLCHTKDLLTQTVKRIKSLYPNMKVGTITDGKVNMVQDGITVSTIQTLVNIDLDIYKDKFGTIITDECFPAGTKVNTPKGYKNIENIKVGDIVWSYNHKTKQLEPKKVKHLFVKTSNNLHKLNLKDKTIIATGSHPFYTQRGYVALEEVKNGDYVLCNVQENNKWVRVESVENFKQESETKSAGSIVYNFEVEDNNNYFVQDVLVHNCHHVSGSPTLQKYFVKVVSKIPARYKYGITASDKRNDSLTKTIYTTIGCNLDGEFAPTWRISREDTKTLTAHHEKVELDTPFSYCFLESDGTFSYPKLVDYIATYEPRNKQICEKIVELCKENRKQLVLCSRVNQCEELHNRLVELGVKSVILVGKVSAKKREQILNQQVDWEVIVATVSLAKEGLDVPILDTLHLVSCISNQSDTIQSAGRIERVCEGKKDPIVFDYVDKNIPYLVSRYKKRVNWLKRRK